MSSFRLGRFVGILVGTVVILGLGVYGPATLLGPLPAVTSTTVIPAAAAAPAPPALSVNGASAIASLPVAGAATVAGPIAVAGVATPLPMASVAKVVTALVALDAKPITGTDTGPTITLTAADYQGYLDYNKASARSVTVFAGEAWTERELLQALLLGSSNNHADTLARWAFGSVDAYVVRANAWLAAQGMTGTVVVDATGLREASVGTATDLARLAGLAATDPIISQILANPASALADRRGIENTTSYLPDEGIRGISRSYTDAAGVCILFTADVTDGKSTFTFAGAYIGEPDYDSLTADLTALMVSARAGVGELPVLASDAAYATFSTVWGDTSRAVVGTARTRYSWQAASPIKPTVTLETFATARKGTDVGRVTVTVAGEKVSAALKLDRAINDPGPGWRLLHPILMITALLDAQR